MTETESGATRVLIITLGVVLLLLAPILYFFQPRQTDCVVYANGVVGCGAPRKVVGPLAFAVLGCAALILGIRYGRSRMTVREPRGH